MVEIDLTWNDFKNNVSSRSLDHYYYMTSERYNLIAVEGVIVYLHKLDIDNNIEYEAGLKLTANTKATTPKTSTVKPSGNATTVTTHRWTDKCTWYTDAVGVTLETLTTSDNLIFASSNTHWIDLVNGRVFKENDISSPYIVKVYVDSIEVTAGFTIDYEAGGVVFVSDETGIVEVDYYYATTSTFKIIPDINKVITISDSEVQFSDNIVFTSPICFEIWVYDPNDLPNKVLYKSIKYKNIFNVIDSSDGISSTMPAITSAGMTQDLHSLIFNYKTVTELKHSKGAELRIKIEDNMPLTGEYCTATFYIESLADL